MKEGPMDVIELYDMMHQGLKDPIDFISVMDCAYALRAIDINEQGEVFLCLQRSNHQHLK